MILAICKQTKKEFVDYQNKSGVLLRNIREVYPDLPIPSNWKRNKYKKDTGENWLDQFYDYIEKDDDVKPTHKCKLCDWETIDVDNRSGYFKTHLLKTHNITHTKYVEMFKDEEEYFKKDFKRKEFESDKNNWVECLECGGKFSRLGPHIKTHGLTKLEYLKKYNLTPGSLISKNYKEKCIESVSVMNKVLEDSPKNEKFRSLNENNILNFLIEHNIDIQQTNRSILKGKEIDLVSHEHKVGIEFNGCVWHTEWFGGKNKYYHLNKTEGMNQQGYGLIHIFEDEFVYNEEIVLSKIAHIFNLNTKPIIGARKMVVKEVDKDVVKAFMGKNHIQGYSRQTLSYGAYFGLELMGVMSFKLTNPKKGIWELVRFATNIEFRTPGLGDKLFKTFIKHNVYNEIISFADRRWTININSNLYTKLGFETTNILPPDYKYFSSKVDRYKRYHKFGFRKNILHKKYGLSLDLTETEMVKILGFDRVWDCGLVKYTYKKKGSH